MQRTAHETIDPTNMTPEQSVKLAKILYRLGPHGILPAGYHEAYGFELTRALIGRERKLKSADSKIRAPGFRFEVVDQRSARSLLGRGGYGAVFVSEGTIQVADNDEPAIYKEKLGAKQRVVKIMMPDNEVRVARTIRESFLSLINVLHLRAKEPTPRYQGQHPVFYLVMRRMPGKALNEQESAIVELPFEKKLALAYALLDSFNEQLFSKDLVHFDIKPGNIILDYDFAQQQVNAINFIDFGFSQDVSKGPVIPEGGTRAFISPEVVYSIKKAPLAPLEAKHSDVYSLAVLIAGLLYPKNKRLSNIDYVRKQCDGDYIRKTGKENPLEHEVLRHLNKMLKYNAVKRPSFEESIAFFKDIMMRLEPGTSPGSKM